MGRQDLECPERLRQSWPQLLLHERFVVVHLAKSDDLWEVTGRSANAETSVLPPDKIGVMDDIEFAIGRDSAWIWMHAWVAQEEEKYLVTMGIIGRGCLRKDSCRLEKDVRSLFLRHGARPYSPR